MAWYVETDTLRKWLGRAAWACALGLLAMLLGFSVMLDGVMEIDPSGFGAPLSFVGLLSFCVGAGVALLTSVAIALRHLSDSGQSKP